MKTTYALTLFAGVCLAAPVPQIGDRVTGVDNLRRDGTGNLIGAGTADGAVNEMVKNLATPSSDHPSSLDHKAAEIKAAEQKQQKQQPSLLEEVPLVGPLLRPVPLKRSFTGDLSNFPILGSIFGGNQAHPANSPNQEGGGQKPNILRDLTSLLRYSGQKYDENYGQNAGQNEGQNAGQNEGQNAGQNEGQNAGQNEGQNEGQNWAQNSKQSRQLHGIASLLQSLTSSGPETISHKRDEVGGSDYDGLISDAESAATSASGLADAFMNVRRDNSDIADTVTGALESNINQEADLADSIMPERRDVPGTRQTAPVTSGSDSEPVDQRSNNPLEAIAGKAGLGSLFGNSHHGVGLLPMGRRNVQPRVAPIQGSDLPSVLFSGGVLGKLAKTLRPGGL